jgi:predicted nicotinamide N-methyase
VPKPRFQYQTIEFGETDIHVRTLRDRQQYDDAGGVGEKLGISSANWSLFGVVWQSSRILADLMSDFDITGKRILEVGCGIGLPSILLNHRLADITATDYHPEAESYMKENTRLNKDSDIPFVRTGWADTKTNLGQFDLLVGSDIIYEQEHPALVAEFIDQHAKQQCEVIIVDPGRKRHAKFSKKMVTLGYTHSQARPVKSEFLDNPYKGQVIRFTR